MTIFDIIGLIMLIITAFHFKDTYKNSTDNGKLAHALLIGCCMVLIAVA